MNTEESKLSFLMDKVWKDDRVKELGIRKSEVKTIIKVFVEVLGDTLLELGKVKIRGLFTLQIRKIKGRRIRNLHTDEEMYSSDSHRIGVIPSKDMKEKLKKLK